jgi:hypothetical protein
MLCLAATLLGCAVRSESGTPLPPQLFLVDDGQHNGFLVERRGLRFDPLKDQLGQSTGPRWVEVALTERDWMLGVDRSTLRALRMLIDPGQAMITYLYHEDLAEAVGSRSLEPIPTTPSGLESWNQFLAQWSDFTAPVERLSGEQVAYLVRSTYPYTLLRNCRVFTAEARAAFAP